MRNLVVSRRVAGVAALGAAAVVLAACGGSSGAASPSGAVSAAARNGKVFGPAASGEIAAKSGNTLQVQNSTSQTAVTYTRKTKFTAEQATTLAAVRAGSCVAVSSAGSSASSSSEITAASVRIVSSSGGDCNLIGGRQSGGPPSVAMPSGMTVPSGVPTTLPSGMPKPSGAVRGTGMGFVIGKVTAVSGNTITVSVSATGSSKATTSTVHVTPSTKYTKTVKATSAAARVGKCAVVQGDADSSGAVTAKSIAVSDKTNGSCTAFGPGGGTNG